MTAAEARAIYFSVHLANALQQFYEVIGEMAPIALSGNLYETAKNYNYATLRLVAEELEKNGYRVAYVDGEMFNTGIFSVSWEG